MATTFLKVSDNGESSLYADITSTGQTTVTIPPTDVSLFPSSGSFKVDIYNNSDPDSATVRECVTVTSIASNVWTVTRGSDSTTASTFITGNAIRLNILAQSLTDLNTAVNTIENKIDGTSIGVTINNSYKFRAYLAGAQNSTAGSFVKVNIDTESFDTNNNFTGGSYTVPVTGYYQINGRAGVNASMSIIIVSIFKNGVEFIRGLDIRATPATAQQGISVNDLVFFTAGDVIDLRVYASAVGVIDPGFDRSYMSGFFVSK